MFRTLNEMIDLLDEFGRIPDYWIKISKVFFRINLNTEYLFRFFYKKIKK